MMESFDEDGGDVGDDQPEQVVGAAEFGFDTMVGPGIHDTEKPKGRRDIARQRPSIHPDDWNVPCRRVSGAAGRRGLLGAIGSSWQRVGDAIAEAAREVLHETPVTDSMTHGWETLRTPAVSAAKPLHSAMGRGHWRLDNSAIRQLATPSSAHSRSRRWRSVRNNPNNPHPEYRNLQATMFPER
jgi:hypothetical protein